METLHASRIEVGVYREGATEEGTPTAIRERLSAICKAPMKKHVRETAPVSGR